MTDLATLHARGMCGGRVVCTYCMEEASPSSTLKIAAVSIYCCSKCGMLMAPVKQPVGVDHAVLAHADQPQCEYDGRQFRIPITFVEGIECTATLSAEPAAPTSTNS